MHEKSRMKKKNFMSLKCMPYMQFALSAFFNKGWTKHSGAAQIGSSEGFDHFFIPLSNASLVNVIQSDCANEIQTIKNQPQGLLKLNELL
jgi:hypothetical protein